AVEWLATQSGDFRTTTARALRFLDRLRGLYAFLVEAGHLRDAWELERARGIVASGRGLPRPGQPPHAGAEQWPVLRAADGRSVPLCIAELWLCILWADGGRSWGALEERVAGAPGAASKLSAVDRLRARLAEGRCSDPEALLPRPLTIADREAAL